MISVGGKVQIYVLLNSRTLPINLVKVCIIICSRILNTKCSSQEFSLKEFCTKLVTKLNL